MEAIAYGDVDKPVFSAYRDGRLGAVHGKGKKPFSLAAA